MCLGIIIDLELERKGINACWAGLCVGQWPGLFDTDEHICLTHSNFNNNVRSSTNVNEDIII